MYKQWDDYFEYLKKLIWAKKKKSSTRKKKEASEKTDYLLGKKLEDNKEQINKLKKERKITFQKHYL